MQYVRVDRSGLVALIGRIRRGTLLSQIRCCEMTGIPLNSACRQTPAAGLKNTCFSLHLEQPRVLCCRHYHGVLLALVLLPFYLQAVTSQTKAHNRTQGTRTEFVVSVVCKPLANRKEQHQNISLQGTEHDKTLLAKRSPKTTRRNTCDRTYSSPAPYLLPQLRYPSGTFPSLSSLPNGLNIYLGMLKKAGNARTWSRLISRRSRSLSRFCFWTVSSLVSITPWSDAISFSTASIPSRSP